MIDRDKPLCERFPESRYSLGEESYGDLTVLAWDNEQTLTIGRYCSFAMGVKILLGGNHRTDWVTTFPFSARWPCAEHIKGHPATKGPVHIGSDVWVAADALILSGLSIGSGAVIGARSLVNKDIPPYAIVAGSPAKVIDYRFNPREITRLLKLAWWDWRRDRIEKAIPFMLSTDIENFLGRAEAGEI